MAEQKERFILLFGEYPPYRGTEIWVDRLTGVNYLWHKDGNAGGLTPLLQADGSPVVTPPEELEGK